MGYDKSPDYGGRPPLSPRPAIAVVIYVAVVALFVWLVKGWLLLDLAQNWPNNNDTPAMLIDKWPISNLKSICQLGIDKEPTWPQSMLTN